MHPSSFHYIMGKQGLEGIKCLDLNPSASAYLLACIVGTRIDLLGFYSQSKMMTEFQTESEFPRQLSPSPQSGEAKWRLIKSLHCKNK